ncbi:hypothetical protein CEP10_07315 [Cylindrospermopsis raciborskii S07]|uniref:Uncharacterized protein n=3 Tax=Cylindrospermopsis raciborskii TaxID=77022 RepID=A0A853MEU1_9CYAN|nr:hypothetical protein [Cylindrospermopsis raciborskii]EFA71265.1 conserved hypothetical protein [Cylindrospermopsis raciborskii CS-505]MBA4446471.1 hypothetical protein [Cylindrospermopsis raciborskii CS-506_C]MBA4450704.1 hypothetical protein [Cylindrospermopsis raciborskii CS-506_D]MBA4457311.1 hypothetical protein [Cylindrospermopsis raciborskii CS-506_B]MBA4466683.1 hypothetical protein [Cylindrospermopsis raciborskii CS-506_A]
MKPGLKRIEATLHDLGIRNPESLSAKSPAKKRPFSFRVSLGSDTTQLNNTGQETVDINSNKQEHISSSVPTFPTQDIDSKTPDLPKFKTPSFSNHRHSANPGFTIGLLQEIQQTVVAWQVELEIILQQIQYIYLEGQVINGWLESNTQPMEGTATLRHGEIEAILDYVQKISQSEVTVNQSSRTDYRLCGVDANGQLWSRPCSVEEVPSLSIAIARYQKLRQLLGRKHYLESRLTKLSETLVDLQGSLK